MPLLKAEVNTSNPTKSCSTRFLPLGMLAKKKLIFCLLETGGGGGGHIKSVSNNPKNELFLLEICEKKSSFFDVLETKGGGAAF